MISELFPDVGAAFRERIYTHQPVCAHGPLERFGLGSAVNLLRTPGIFAASRMTRITAYVKGRDGATRHASVPPDVAATLYDSGATVEVPDVAEFFSPVARLQQKLAAELGEHPGHAVAIATPPGADAVPMHFDRHCVFVFQLAGSKRWTVAPNESLPFPMHAFSPTLRGGQRDGDRWRGYFPPSLPSAMPGGATEWLLQPGSVAYVPAGCWHATSSTEGSVSLTLAISPPRFLELFLTTLSERLVEVPELRRPVCGTFGAPRYAPREQVRLLLAVAQALVSELRVDDMLPLSAGSERYVRAPSATLRVVWARGQRELLLCTGGAERPLAHLVADADAFAAWFNEIGAPVSGDAITQRLRGSLAGDERELLRLMEKLGAVCRVDVGADDREGEGTHAPVS